MKMKLKLWWVRVKIDRWYTRQIGRDGWAW